MKRSTLTLSILTALLVSACGGSSSNDEQTKDPTPPKVTPTKPTTPSTGNTSTTGNTGNAGTSGSSAGSSASSSSSDPTPPISSGSAPSGGKPIVIEAEKQEEKTPGGEEPTDPPVDPLKESLEKAKQELKAIYEQKETKERALNLLVKIDENTKEPKEGIVPTKWQEQNKLRENLLKDLGFTGDDLKNLGIETIKQKIESDPQYADKSDDLEKYEKLREDWLKSKADMLKLRAEVQELEQQSFDKRKEVKTLEYKQKIENAEVKSERDYLTKKEQKEQFDLDKEKAEAESTDIKTNLAQNEIEKGILEKQQKDLEKAIALAKENKKDHADLDAQLTQVKANLEQNEKDKTSLERDQKTAEDAAKTAGAKSKSIENTVKSLEKIAQNRGVIGSTGLSDENFLEIDRAKFKDNEWILDLKSGERIKISTAAGDNKAKYTPTGGNEETYATFGKDTTSGLQTAFNHIGSNAQTSIYGYVGDQFYSVGKVADAEKVKALNPNARYTGKALLKADPTKAGEGKHSDLVADVVVNLNLTQNKLSGNFDKFATYQRGENSTPDAVLVSETNTNVSDDLKAALKSPVTFNASIKGNKFATGADDKSQASVYGYFYGDEAKEVGGLVELQDVFHGSFGGEIK